MVVGGDEVKNDELRLDSLILFTFEDDFPSIQVGITTTREESLIAFSDEASVEDNKSRSLTKIARCNQKKNNPFFSQSKASQ